MCRRSLENKGPYSLQYLKSCQVWLTNVLNVRLLPMSYCSSFSQEKNNRDRIIETLSNRQSAKSLHSILVIKCLLRVLYTLLLYCTNKCRDRNHDDPNILGATNKLAFAGTSTKGAHKSSHYDISMNLRDSWGITAHFRAKILCQVRKTSILYYTGLWQDLW